MAKTYNPIERTYDELHEALTRILGLAENEVGADTELESLHVSWWPGPPLIQMRMTLLSVRGAWASAGNHRSRRMPVSNGRDSAVTSWLLVASAG